VLTRLRITFGSSERGSDAAKPPLAMVRRWSTCDLLVLGILGLWSCPPRTPATGRNSPCQDAARFGVSEAKIDKGLYILNAMNAACFLARGDATLYFFDYDNDVFKLDTADLDRELA
jgi:hypothetical protein